MAGKDYYDTLGISRNATEGEIKSAYKKLAKQWHPDVNKDPQSTEKFKEISEAYAVLSDSQKRAAYDQYGHDAFKQGFSGEQGFSGSGDFSDFFGGNFSDFGGMEELFRQAFGGGFASGNARRSANLNLRAEVDLTFEEAAFGTKKKLSVKHLRACPTCKGSGSATGKKETCTICKGRGMQTKTQRTPFGLFQTTMPCATCQGSGETAKDPCEKCDGQGVQRRMSEIEISFPAGIDTGNHVRVPGQGNASSHGNAGDLFIIVHVKPHATFKRDGFDVLVEKELSFADAALGTEMDVPVIDGNATITIPPGTPNGRVFRLKGKGIRRLDTASHGDEYVRVNITVPTKLSKREKELLEELRALSHGTQGHDANKKAKPTKKGFFGL